VPEAEHDSEQWVQQHVGGLDHKCYTALLWGAYNRLGPEAIAVSMGEQCEAMVALRVATLLTNDNR